MATYNYDVEVLPYDGAPPIIIGRFMLGSVGEAIKKISLVIIGQQPPLDLDSRVQVISNDPGWQNPHMSPVGDYIPAVLHAGRKRSGTAV